MWPFGKEIPDCNHPDVKVFFLILLPNEHALNYKGSSFFVLDLP